MSERETGQNAVAMGAVALLAAAICIIGLAARPSSQHLASLAPGALPVAPAGVPADAAAGAAANAAQPLDPQPNIAIGHLSFTIPGRAVSPEGAALLARLGGTDLDLRGLVPADPAWDDMTLQRAIRGVPGAAVDSMMGVLARGGEQTGITCEVTTVDPVTGLEIGQRTVLVETVVTVLEDCTRALTASIRDVHDPSALAVAARRAGVPIGRSDGAEGALLLTPGEPAVIRLPGPRLRLVVIQISVRGETPAPATAQTPENPPP